MEDLKKEILKTICRELSIDSSKLTPELDLKKELGIDSLEFMSLLITLEEALNIKVDDKEIKELKTYQDLENLLIKKKLG